MSYFSLLNLDPCFDLDIAALEAEYFKAQRLYHPDRFVRKTAEEKLAALQKSMDINQAYDALKNPLTRAQHLLSLEGIIVGGDNDTVKPSPALLMEIMELREMQEEGKAYDISKLYDESVQNISRYYSARNFANMAAETLRLGYLSRTRRLDR